VSITPAECKAARELIGWSRTRLTARADDISESTIRTFEGGRRPAEQKIIAIERALEAAGVIFVEENGDGPGVKLRKDRK
jgi:ribosome-binding protein aMBF1 (putative translation factor)